MEVLGVNYEFTSDTDETQNFYLVQDGEELGIEAETLDAAKFAAKTIIEEGQYSPPIDVMRPDGTVACTAVTDPQSGRLVFSGIWGAS